MFPEEVRNIYNTRYRAPFSGFSYGSAVDNDIFIVTKLLTKSAPRNICDLCCGLGIHILKLAEIPGYSVVGVDYSSVAFERYLATHGHLLNPTYICKSVSDYVVAIRKQFDAVLCYLPHFDSAFEDDTKGLLSAMWQLCKKGGVAILSFLCADYAPLMSGETIVSYDQQSSVSIASVVTYCSSSTYLRIRQTSDAWEGEIVEEMRLYTIAEIKQRLYKTGFESVVSIDMPKDFKDIAVFQRVNESKATLICQK
jgi:SAM-dependent methyltransferase